MVYIVKGKNVDSEGMEVDPIRFVTLDRWKAEEYVDMNGDSEFLWIDGHEIDGVEVTHIE